MNAQLTFALPEEQEELNTCLKASELLDAVNEFYLTSIRNRLKYTELSETDSALLETIKSEFFEAVGDFLR